MLFEPKKRKDQLNNLLQLIRRHGLLLPMNSGELNALFKSGFILSYHSSLNVPDEKVKNTVNSFTTKNQKFFNLASLSVEKWIDAWRFHAGLNLQYSDSPPIDIPDYSTQPLANLVAQLTPEKIQEVVSPKTYASYMKTLNFILSIDNRNSDDYKRYQSIQKSYGPIDFKRYVYTYLQSNFDHFISSFTNDISVCSNMENRLSGALKAFKGDIYSEYIRVMKDWCHHQKWSPHFDDRSCICDFCGKVSICDYDSDGFCKKCNARNPFIKN